VFDLSPLRKGASAQEQAQRIEPDFKAGMDLFDYVPPTDFVMGNHDYRAWAIAKDDPGPVGDFCRHLVREVEGWAKKYGVTLYPYRANVFCKLGPTLKAMHGNVCNLHAAKSLAEAYGCIIGGHTHSVCTVNHAEAFWAQYQDFVKNPGPVVIGAMPMASCFGPAYEFAFILDADLRKRKIRNKVPITFVTSEPYIGHLGLGGVGDSKSMLESEMRGHDIKWITNAKTTKVEAGKLFATQLDDQGKVVAVLRNGGTFEVGDLAAIEVPSVAGDRWDVGDLRLVRLWGMPRIGALGHRRSGQHRRGGDRDFHRRAGRDVLDDRGGLSRHDHQIYRGHAGAALS
jgi:hypothetical protein